MDFLNIKRLQVESLVGIHPWEQAQKQLLYINLSLAIDLPKAASRDSIEDAVDYQQLANEIRALVEQNHFQLIESVAQSIILYLQQHYGATQASVEIIKPSALPTADEVSVVTNLGSP